MRKVSHIPTLEVKGDVMESGKMEDDRCVCRTLYELWRILDDIDTGSDMYKDNYEGLSRYVYDKQQERHLYLSDDEVDRMYDLYNMGDY